MICPSSLISLFSVSRIDWESFFSAEWSISLSITQSNQVCLVSLENGNGLYVLNINEQVSYDKWALQIRRHISSNFHGINPFLPCHFKTVRATKARSIIIGILINKRTKRTKEQIFEHSYCGTIEKKFLEIWMFVRKKLKIKWTQIHKQTKQSNKIDNPMVFAINSLPCFVHQVSKKYQNERIVTLLFCFCCWIVNATKVLLVIYVHE